MLGPVCPAVPEEPGGHLSPSHTLADFGLFQLGRGGGMGHIMLPRLSDLPPPLCPGLGVHKNAANISRQSLILTHPAFLVSTVKRTPFILCKQCSGTIFLCNGVKSFLEGLKFIYSKKTTIINLTKSSS